MTNTDRRQELRSRWVNLQQKMSDVLAPRPSDEELIAFLKEADDHKETVSGLQYEVWRFLDERGCLTEASLRWIEVNVPSHVEVARKHLRLVVMQVQEAEEALEASRLST